MQDYGNMIVTKNIHYNHICSIITVPSVVKFSSTSFTYDTDDNWVEVCIHLPLYEIHSHNADGIIMVALNFRGYNPILSGEDVMFVL